MGYGGSVLQWHPEHKIGFGYQTFFHHPMDFWNLRPARIQKIVTEIATGTYNENNYKEESSCTCSIF